MVSDPLSFLGYIRKKLDKNPYLMTSMLERGKQTVNNKHNMQTVYTCISGSTVERTEEGSAHMFMSALLHNQEVETALSVIG